MARAVVLDVAHGNCTIGQSSGATIIADAPIGGLLLNTLEDLNICRVDAVFISHADNDHINGILALLTSPKIHVENVFVNPDSIKKTRSWRNFLVAVGVAERNGTPNVHTSLTTTAPGKFKFGDAVAQVVAPSAAFALSGVGSNDKQGRKITSNSLSAVLTLSIEDQKSLLLPGDIDEIGLDAALENHADFAAGTVVFPHHGGLSGATDHSAFVKKFLAISNPSQVIFSNGRNRHDNPRADVVSLVKEHGCAIACTQLSVRCCATPQVGSTDHLESFRAMGAADGASCAGSVSVDLLAAASRKLEAADLHLKFVKSLPTAMCRK
jgi:beta-lactamase superfamily II metal-dependent hydrolase